MSELPNALSVREADRPVEPLFLQRWSPRAMSGEALAEEELMRLFEAARWAPSTYNEQEWRFLYARRQTPHWDAFFGLLAEPNQAWCGKAAVLGVVLSKKTFTRNGKPNPVHTFDSGLAYQNLSLQGAAMGLVVHGMAGFDFDKARRELNVPEDFAVEAMFAVGRHGDPADLPEELREREEPSGRKPVGEIVCEGPFAF
ncbi:nitroreductase family protein [Alienimonas sp. DA493]|uniref:nitroreductase family protein n=1 Tax=Alienimonas sp. DA493 TaxID=3373605 RepID=UPI003754ADD9